MGRPNARTLTAAVAAATLVGGLPGAVAAQEVSLDCRPQQPMEEVEERVSPYDSATVTVAGETAKVCYSRPSLRGRTMIGNPEHVPYGELWRTGANEPTIIHIPFAAEIAGIRVDPGSYSLYTIPRKDDDWTVIVNAATSQWGHERFYNEAVAAKEVGRATVPAEETDGTIETFTIRGESADDLSHLILEWQDTRVRVPVRKVDG